MATRSFDDMAGSLAHLETPRYPAARPIRLVGVAANGPAAPQLGLTGTTTGALRQRLRSSSCRRKSLRCS